ncbi:hypothetical protein Tco_0822114 [Tanacetum coccineum]|uniref:Uncharacterized protein n=1 Tax=Tanacetum coccineum TaxID=301880 RepID=A0ABQ5AE85_9ASTR
MKCVTMDSVKPKVLTPGMYVIDVEPIPPRCRNNREVHLDYLKHLKESVETLHEIVEEARVERPLDRSLASACLYTKQSQELLEYAIGTCPKDFNKQDKKHATTPLNKKKKSCFGSSAQNICGGKSLLARNCVIKKVIGNSQIPRMIILLLSMGLEFMKHSCYVRDTNGVELIKGSLGSNFYTISVEDMMKSSPIACCPSLQEQILVMATARITTTYTTVGTPSSTTIDQDAPSISHSPSSLALQSPSSHQGVAAGSLIIEDNPFPHADNDPFVNVFALEPSSEASSFGDVSSAESTHVTQPHHHLGKWSKDHPFKNVISNPS